MNRFFLFTCCFLGIFSAAFFSACTPESKTDETYRYANVFVRYLAAEQAFKGQASFYEGISVDSTKSKQISGGVAFMGSNMGMRALPGDIYRYTYLFQSEYVNPSSFSWKWDKEEPLSKVDLRMSPIKNFELTQGSLSKGITVVIDSPLKENESLLLFFMDENQQARQVEKLGDTKSATLFFPPKSLVNLAAGNHDLYLVKKKKTEEKENGMTVLKEIEYYTVTQQIILVE